MLILLIRSHPRDPACLAMRAPERRIDLIVGVERSSNDIRDTGIAVRVTGFAGELDPDLPKKALAEKHSGSAWVGMAPCQLA